MIAANQHGQKQVRGSVARSKRLDQIHNLYISEATWLFWAGTIVAVLTFLLFATGLIAWFAGIAPQGWIATAFSPATALLSFLFFNREKAAHEKVESIRISLEKQEEKERKKRDQELEDKRKKHEEELAEERKKRDQELEDKRKRQKEEENVSYKMLMLEAYYRLASKIDDEGQREAYYHELFDPAEYNKRRIEVYFNTVSQIQDENAKKAFFRELFSSLFKAEEFALISPSS